MYCVSKVIGGSLHIKNGNIRHHKCNSWGGVAGPLSLQVLSWDANTFRFKNIWIRLAFSVQLVRESNRIQTFRRLLSSTVIWKSSEVSQNDAVNEYYVKRVNIQVRMQPMIVGSQCMHVPASGATYRHRQNGDSEYHSRQLFQMRHPYRRITKVDKKLSYHRDSAQCACIGAHSLSL